MLEGGEGLSPSELLQEDSHATLATGKGRALKPAVS